MLRLRPIFWPTAIMLPIIVFSLGLGVWQMDRREWKRGILDRIAVNQAAAPMPFDAVTARSAHFRCGRVTRSSAA